MSNLLLFERPDAAKATSEQGRRTQALRSGPIVGESGARCEGPSRYTDVALGHPVEPHTVTDHSANVAVSGPQRRMLAATVAKSQRPVGPQLARTWCMDDVNSSLESTIVGRLVGAAGRTDPDGVTVWFSYVPADGEGSTVETTADSEGRFTFALPSGAMNAAKVGAHLEGVRPVDLEPNGEHLEPGDLVLIVDDIIPSHVRFAG